MHKVREAFKVGPIGGFQRGQDFLRVELLPQVVAGKDDGPAGVFLLGDSIQVCGKGNLCLYLLLAVAKIVVRDGGDHASGFVAQGELEGAAVVVEFVLVLPAHAVLFLAFRGFIRMRQSHILFLEGDEVGGEDNASAVACPVLDVNARVVLDQEGIPGVTENALHEVEVGSHGGRGKETGLERLLAYETLNFRTHNGSQEEGTPAVHGIGASICKRQL